MPGDMLFFFAALCLFFSSIEYAIPKPLPFMRLGLANLPVIFAVKHFHFQGILFLILLKVILASFISGTTFSYVFLFSAAGSFASGLAVYLLYQLLKKCGLSTQVSNLGLCLTGALANNAAQIAVARLFIFGKQAYFIAPLLLASGLVSGILLGAFANRFEDDSLFLLSLRGGKLPHPDSDRDERLQNIEQEERGQECENRGKTIFTHCLTVCSLLLMLALPFLPGLPLKASAWLLLLVAAELSRKGKVRLLPSFILILSLTALALFSPSGKVLRTIGSFRITAGALETGLSKSLTLTGMLFASQAIFASFQSWKISTGEGSRGKFLRSLSRVFGIFAALSERKLDIQGRGLVAALDDRLFEVWQGRPPQNAADR